VHQLVKKFDNIKKHGTAAKKVKANVQTWQILRVIFAIKSWAGSRVK
jgi:hypothetical protein